MLRFSLVCIIIALLCGALCVGLFLLAMRAQVLRNGATPFECGFDPKGSARTPFSLRFFLLAVFFLVFDVEVALLLPLPLVVGSGYVGVGVMVGVVFMIILLAGLFHEWREGSLDWV